MVNDIHAKETRIGVEQAKPQARLTGGLEQYTIKREIGHGGMAVVYEAVEKSLDRIVALKVLSKEFSRDVELIRRFVHEAQAAARLSHPNIVQIYSIGEEKDTYYFAMEYIRGHNVEEMLRDGRILSVPESLDIIRQTAIALQEAYKYGIVHRDIKPGNIMITEQGMVKVADFGLAGEVKGEPHDGGGRVIGTPLYMSPEQAQGREGDHRSDMYSLGITFYQMLSGKPPFAANDTRDIIDCQIKEPLPPLPHSVPPAVAKFIGRLTEKDPEKRFPDYESILKVLDRLYEKFVYKKHINPVLLSGLVVVLGITAFSVFYKPLVTEIPVPLRTERDLQIEQMYENVKKYARENPDAHREIIKEYSRIIREYPGTEWSYRAEQKIDMIIVAVVQGAAAELKNLKELREELLEKDKFYEAVEKYLYIKKKYQDTAAESYAQENIDYIFACAAERFKEYEQKSGVLINGSNFTEARKVWHQVIENFGIGDYIARARKKIIFINTLEAEEKMNTEAKEIFEPIDKEVAGLMVDNKYQDARAALLSIVGKNENPKLSGLIEGKLSVVDELQLEYESKILKEKMEKQYAVFQELNDEVEILLSDFKFDNALEIINRDKAKVEIGEWSQKLEGLAEKVEYLMLMRASLINGINSNLSQAQKEKGAAADKERLIFIVEGGFVGIPWRECAPDKIYQLALKYMERDTAEQHIALGVFCMVYGWPEESRKEFALALRKDPGKRDVVEKYLTQLAEKEK